MVASLSKIENLRLQISARFKISGNPLAAEFEITNSRFQVEAPKGKEQAPVSRGPRPYAPLAQNLKYQVQDFRSKGK
jgi:hypothetical protein